MMMLRTNYLKPPPKVVVKDNPKQYTSVSKKDIEFESLVQEEMRKIENNLKKEMYLKSNNDNINDIQIYAPPNNDQIHYYNNNNNNFEREQIRTSAEDNNYNYLPNNNYSRPVTEWDGLKPTTSETNIIPIKITYDDKSRPQTEYDNIDNNIDNRLPINNITMNQPRRKGDLIHLHDNNIDRLNSKAAKAALYANQLQQQVLEKQRIEQLNINNNINDNKNNNYDDRNNEYRKKFLLTKQAEYKKILDNQVQYAPVPPPNMKHRQISNQDTKQTGLLIGQMTISSAESRALRRKQQMMYNQQLLKDINVNTNINNNDNININSNSNSNSNTNTNTITNSMRNEIYTNEMVPPTDYIKDNAIDDRLAEYIRSLERENEEYRRNVSRISNPNPNPNTNTNTYTSSEANPISSMEEKIRIRPTIHFNLPDEDVGSNRIEDKKLPVIKTNTNTNTNSNNNNSNNNNNNKESENKTKDPAKSPTKARMKLLTDVYGSSAFSSMSGLDLPTNPAPSSSSSSSSSSTSSSSLPHYDPKSPPKSPTKARLMKYNEVYGKTQLFNDDDSNDVVVKTQQVKSPTKARMRMLSDVYGVSNVNSGNDVNIDNNIDNQSITRPLRDNRHDNLIMDQKSALADQIAEKKRIKAEEKMKEKLADEEDERRIRRELEELGEFERSVKATKRAEAEAITKELINQQEKQFQQALERKGKAKIEASKDSSPPKSSFLNIKAPPKVNPPVKSPPKGIVEISPNKNNNNESYERSSSLPHLAPQTNYQPVQMFNPINNPRQFADDSDFNAIVDRFRPSSTDEVDSFLVNWQRHQYESLAAAKRYPNMQYQQHWPAFPPTADKKGGMRDMAATGVLQFSVESRFIPHDSGVMNDGLLTALGQLSSSSTTKSSPDKELASKSINVGGQGLEQTTFNDNDETSTLLLGDSSLLYGGFQNNDDQNR